MSKKRKQLFFSHTWHCDNLGRDTHQRVHELVKKIRYKGWTTWFDEEDMGGNIDAAMAEGIDCADAVILCLSETYFNKVQETAKDPRKRDNCLKEWTYMNTRNKLIIPVIMEPCLQDVKNWPPGIISLYLGSTLYIDASNDFDKAIESIHKFLYQESLQPDITKPSYKFKTIHRAPPPPPLNSNLLHKSLPPIPSFLSMSLLSTLQCKSNGSDKISTDDPLYRSYTRIYSKKKNELPVRSLSLSDKSDFIPNKDRLFRRRWHSTSNIKEIVL